MRTTLRPRRGGLDLAGRLVAALPLNYAVTAIVTGLLARHLPGARAEATMAATLASFAIFAVLAMAAFHVRSSGRFCLVLAGATGLLGGLLALSIALGGRL